MSYYAHANSHLVALADPTAKTVVELGCGSGTAAAQLKCANPTGRFIGIEFMPGPAADAREIFDAVIEADIENPDSFAQLDEVLAAAPIDLLVIGDVLEHLKDPWSVMRLFHKRMAPDGRLLLSLPNVSHWSLILRQLKGDWTYTDSGLLDRTHLRYFTRTTGHRMLTESGWHVSWSLPRVFNKPQSKQVIDALTSLSPQLDISPGQMRRDLSALQWVYSAAAGPEEPAHRIHAIGIGSALDSLTTIRLAHPLETLRGMGRAQFRLMHGRFELPSLDEPPGILLTYRLHPSGDQWEHLARLLRKGWLFVHDVDDHPAYLKAQKRLDFRSIREAHAVTVSTPELAEVCRKWTEHVHVVPNQIRTLAPPQIALAPNSTLSVFWGALNREEQWDPGAREAVLTTLAEPDTQTIVIADDNFADTLGDKATKLPLQSYADYRKHLATADVALLPLVPSEFTACKSDLKIIECLASGVVPLCSAYAASRSEVPQDLLLVAESAADWSRHLGRLRDPDFRAGMQRVGYAWVSQNRMWAGAGTRLDTLYQKLWSERASLDEYRRARVSDEA